MKQLNFIKTKTMEEVRKQVTALYEKEEEIVVTVKKTRTKGAQYTVKIEGVYSKFFTVMDEKLGVAFTIQYVDVLTGNVKVEKKEGL